MSEAKTRNLTIDLIKAVAIIGVLMIHVGSGVLITAPVGTPAWFCGLFWGALVRGSVPLFLMASGAIMLDSDKELSLKKLYFHNVARILVAMLVWGFLYKTYHLFMAGQFNLPMLWYSVKRLLLFDQEFHFYYIHMILIVYVFLPMTRAFARAADKKLLQYSLVVWGIFAVVYPTLCGVYPFCLLSGLTGQWAINLTFASIGYGLFGYYLKKHPFSLRGSLACLIVGFGLTFGGTYFASLKAGALSEMFLQGTSPGVCLLAAGVFSLGGFIQVKGRLARAVVTLSKASFCVYLSHMFVLYTLENFGVSARLFLPILSVPLISLLVLLICLALFGILSKIPVLNRYLI